MSFIGTAGWTIPAQYKSAFPGEGSHLQRYASRLNCAEINSSFYRPHKRATYEKWAASVPDGFRFSVKVPRTITQKHRFAHYGDKLDQFLEEAAGLGDKLGVLLAQLPPSLVYDPDAAEAFFRDLAQANVTMACEPRHISWFTSDCEKVLKRLHVVR